MSSGNHHSTEFKCYLCQHVKCACGQKTVCYCRIKPPCRSFDCKKRCEMCWQKMKMKTLCHCCNCDYTTKCLCGVVRQPKTLCLECYDTDPGQTLPKVSIIPEPITFEMQTWYETAMWIWLQYYLEIGFSRQDLAIIISQSDCNAYFDLEAFEFYPRNEFQQTTFNQALRRHEAHKFNLNVTLTMINVLPPPIVGLITDLTHP